MSQQQHCSYPHVLPAPTQQCACLSSSLQPTSMHAPCIMCCSIMGVAHSLPTFLLLLPSFHFSGQATACSFFSHVAQTMMQAFKRQRARRRD
jgi:hypothetical protein